MAIAVIPSEQPVKTPQHRASSLERPDRALLGQPSLSRLALTVCAMVAGTTAIAQTARPPDAGLLKREETVQPAPRLPTAPVRGQPVVTPAGAASAPAAAERRVPLRAVRVEGVTVLDVDALVASLGPIDGRQFSLGEMRQLAEQVQQRVQAAGRPFARAYLPPQDLSGGQLRIAVVEGRYGKVSIEGEAAVGAAPWLAPLSEGKPIGPELARQVQALDDLPGIDVTATMSPGQQGGEGDLAVSVSPGRRFGGEIRVDNEGSRYAGRHRVTGTAYGNSLLTFGDRGVLSASVNDGKGWQGAAAYSLPLGVSGLRGGLSASRSHYALGKTFAPLDAVGRVDAFGAQLTVPLTMSPSQRVDLQVGLQHQDVRNQQRAVGAADRRRINLLTGALQGSRLLAGGGAMWGRASAEAGEVRLGEAQLALDRRTAGTQGGYLLVGVDAGLRMPIRTATLALRASGQLADRNLDSSRKFVLGGADGVRAWPAAEAAGDDGVLVQAELRHALGPTEPFVFVDAGQVKLNHRPWDNADNARSIAGAGLGLRWSQGPWRVQGTAGWRLGADRGRPVSDPAASNPQLWLSLAYAL